MSFIIRRGDKNDVPGIFRLIKELALFERAPEAVINTEKMLLEEIAGAPPDFEDDPLDLLVRAEQEAEFMKLVDRLPLPQRSVVVLHFVEEFSLGEIAAITKAQLGTVKSRLHYAKKALRSLLEEGDRN